MVRPEGLSFDELQLRLHPAASRVRTLSAEIPATLILFDLLEEAGEDLRDEPLEVRRERLAALAERIGADRTPEQLADLSPGPDLRLTPWTDVLEVARRWYEDEAGLGQDGDRGQADRTDVPAGRSRLGQGEASLDGRLRRRRVPVVQEGDGVGSLLLGLFDGEGRLHYVGHTSSFRAAERRAIRAALAPLEGGAGFGEGRAFARRAEPLVDGWEAEWVSLDPVLVCEVRSSASSAAGSGTRRRSCVGARTATPASCRSFAQLGASPPSWWGEGAAEE